MSKNFSIDLQWENGVCMLAHSFLIKSSSKLLVTRTGIKARMSLISGLWFPWPIYMFCELTFDLGTLDSGERSLPFGLLVCICENKGADQMRDNCAADQRPCFRYIDSPIPLISKSKI